MEFIARTVTHPDPKISKEDAERQLIAHPEFKKGSVIVAMTKEAGRWVAQLHEPKVAAPPPFPPSDDGDTPADDPKPPTDDEPEVPESDDSDDEGDDKEDKPKKSEKVEIGDVLDLVKQIAQAVGVPIDDGGDGPGGPDVGPDGPPPGPDGPPGDDPPPGLAGGPPHDETLPGGDAGTKQIIHRKAPPGAVPIGTPAFASAQPKVASFELNEEVPEGHTIKAAKEEIESIYGPYGYKVKKIKAETVDGKRVIRAKVSVR